jgi:hypothetical protein
MLHVADNIIFDVYVNEFDYCIDLKTGKFVHRIIAGKKFGRDLYWWEETHHIDKNKQNNNPENLFVCCKDFHRLIHSLNIGKNEFWPFVYRMREENRTKAYDYYRIQSLSNKNQSLHSPE